MSPNIDQPNYDNDQDRNKIYSKEIMESINKLKYFIKKEVEEEERCLITNNTHHIFINKNFLTIFIFSLMP